MQEAYPIMFQGISKDDEQRNIKDNVGIKGGCMSRTPISITFYVKKTLYFIFIVKFEIINHVGSRMTVINYVEYFIS